MTTNTMPRSTMPQQHATSTDFARYLAPLGRLFLSLVFLQTLLVHFSPSTFVYAGAQGVPLPSVLVPLSGVMAIAGGLSVTLGYRTRLGAALLIAFLIPVTLFMHQFWNVADPRMAQVQGAMFMKNVSILGGVMLLAYFGPGPFSMDARRQDSEPTRSGR